MKQVIKQAFKDDAIDHVTAFDNEGNQFWLHENFTIFVVEGEGRKPFKTFDGAFNHFMKQLTHGEWEMEVMMPDGDIVDIDTFCMQ